MAIQVSKFQCSQNPLNPICGEWRTRNEDACLEKSELAREGREISSPDVTSPKYHPHNFRHNTDRKSVPPRSSAKPDRKRQCHDDRVCERNRHIEQQGDKRVYPVCVGQRLSDASADLGRTGERETVVNPQSQVKEGRATGYQESSNASFRSRFRRLLHERCYVLVHLIFPQQCLHFSK